MSIDDLTTMTDRELTELENRIRAEWDNRDPDNADPEGDYPEDQYRNDVEADADVFTSIGWGTDEDYGYYGDDGDMW